jgi:RimJ/RimL family protein N-acetyltransferase
VRTISTARLRLEPVGAANARTLWSLLNAPDLRKYQDIPRVQPEEFERQVRARPRAFDGRSTGRYEWLLSAGDPLEPIGWISLRINDRSSGIGEIGYSLLTPARGRGYATEAVSALVDEWFLESELQEVQACCVPDNEPSRSVLTRAGFREERTIRSGAVIRGRHVDVVLYRLHRAEWSRMPRAGAARQQTRS